MTLECDVCSEGVSGFAVVAGGARWAYAGALTFAEAGQVVAATAALPLPGEGIVDCSGIGAFDSTAVAVLLALKRRAAAEGQKITFAGLPARLEALANLYDVEDILTA
jgi:phospholipid transport system transporter-binding protein